MIGRCRIGELIQCHIDHGDPETFVVGVLISYDDTWFLLKDVSSYGESNGFALYQRCDIVSVKDDSEYLNKIALLIKYNNASWPDIQVSGHDLLIQVIQLCITMSKVVGIEIYASGYRDVNGIIEEVDGNVVTIRQTDEFGQSDGRCWLVVNSITRMYFDDKESTYLGILNSHFNSR